MCGACVKTRSESTDSKMMMRLFMVGQVVEMDRTPKYRFKECCITN